MLFVIVLLVVVVVMKLITEVRKDIAYTKKVRALVVELNESM